MNTVRAISAILIERRCRMVIVPRRLGKVPILGAYLLLDAL